MPANGTYLICITIATLACLLLLILVGKLHAFLALLISSMFMGLAAGMGPEKVLKSIQTGFGDALGFIAVVIGLGAMIGRFLEYSGGGRALADWLLVKFGKDHAAWAVLIASFLVGLPIFFEVGFIILIPIVWSLTRETKRSLLFYGLPMAAALTMTHSLVPPHPAPAAAAQLMGGDLAHTIIYGVMMSIPMTLISGIVYGTWVARRIYIGVPEIAAAMTMKSAESPGAPPPVPIVVLLLLLPVTLTFGATMASLRNIPFRGVAVFLGHPYTALTITTLVALYFFGLRRGLSRDQVLKMATDSLLPIGGLMCIIGGGGALKQVIVDSGVGTYAGKLLMTSAISPLIVVWLIAA
ncbi:MAG TPA: gluconate:H+ symporter, partial [Candidatus Solibacter sp.]